MEKGIYDKRWEVIKKYERRIDSQNVLTTEFDHYTSMQALFSILESDALWAANARFSNDAMEERMMSLDGLPDRDDYILCFCSENDILSQWRGYCHQGGAAIKLNLNYPQEYSILHADYDTSGKFILCENTPLPVLYIDPKEQPGRVRKLLEADIAETVPDKTISVEDMLPYLKNGHFHEEKEMRMVFSNKETALSKCIRFRSLEDGIKVPYIVIKHGNAGKMKTVCDTRVEDFDDEKLLELENDRKPIWIEEGYNQEEKFFQLQKRLDEYREKSPGCDIKILCKGHLPIERITVAPTYDRQRKAEQIKRFCQSKYWLKNVTVEVSDIPYIQPVL